MNTVLVLGTGLQGKAALYDLAVHCPNVEVIAADVRVGDLGDFLSKLPGGRVRAVGVDARNAVDVARLMGQAQAVVMLLPSDLGASLAALAVEHGLHWVDASYALPEYQNLSEEAARRDLALLPEFGLDPGIDLVLAARAVSELDSVTEFYSYGAGIPEPEAAENPLKYKISWNFSGVLRSYARPARLLVNGRPRHVPASALFAEENVHEVYVSGVGRLEAYPNGDVVRYLEPLGLSTVREAGRFSMRWPGHAAFWDKLAKLGFLNEKPPLPSSTDLAPVDYLRELLEPKLQYEPHERDLAIIRVEVYGVKQRQAKRIIYEVVDRRDLRTGLLAMQRTVGFTASIGAQMILRGDIGRRGLLSPARDVPADILIDELGKRGIVVRRTEQDVQGVS